MKIIIGLVIGAVAGILVGMYALSPGDTGPGQQAATDGASAQGGEGAEAAQEEEQVRWRMASAFGSQWPIQGDLGLEFVDKIDTVSDGSIKVRFFEPGALVPALEIFDAVSSGSVDAGWTTAGYWAGKIPAAQFFTAVPFGPEVKEYLAWLYQGGGEELYREIYARHNIHAMHCGLHSPEGSGWFREPIENMEDLEGLKMRFFGLGARVMEKLGVSTQLLAGGDIFPALELGTIDATEYSMPAIDLNQGFYQIAKHYYFPGWHQPTSLFELIVNMDRWNALSEVQKTQVETVCSANFTYGTALSEAMQADALKELEARGVVFHEWSPEMLDAFREAWNEVAAEEAAKDEDFAAVLQSLESFRSRYATWRRLGYLDPE